MVQITKTQVSVDFYRQLYKRTLLERFKNNKIPGIRKLAEDADVSIPSVMDGIDLLERRNVVLRKHGSGIYINDITNRQLSITVLQSDYPSIRYEMLNNSVKQLCRHKKFYYDHNIISGYPTDLEGVPDFSDVIVYIAPSHSLNLFWLAKVEARCGVLVLMDKYPGDFAMDSISLDNESMITQAMQYLYENGHRNIWYLESSPKVYDIFERYYTASKWALLHDIELKHVDCGLKSGEDGYLKGLNVLHELLKTEKKPTAILAINDASSLAARQAVINGGLTTDDISVIGLNDTAEIAKQGLTVVADCQDDFSNALDQLIKERIYEKIGEKLNIRIPGKLIERNSVKNINK